MPNPADTSGARRRSTVKFPQIFAMAQFGSVGIDTLWKADIAVGFPWMNVASYHSQNPGGLAYTYVRKDSPPSVFPWHESSLNITYQEYSNRNYAGLQEPNSIFNFAGLTDSLTDGLAKNMGVIRAFNNTYDALHDAAGGYTDPGGVQSGTVARTLNVADMGSHGTPDLIARVFVYWAKLHGLYANGWNGVWSDNWIGPHAGVSYWMPNHDSDGNGVVDNLTAFRTAWCNGLETIGRKIRDSLPQMDAGGNGALSYVNDPGSGYGWLGTNPSGWSDTANVSMAEGLGYFPAGTLDGQVDQMINWHNQVMKIPDPYGKRRKMIFWDSSGITTLSRMRYLLCACLMCDTAFAAADAPTQHDEYWGGTGINTRGYLGTPVSPAAKTSGVWQRIFSGGAAYCNTSGSSATITVPANLKRLTGSEDSTVNSGAAVSSLTLAAQTGIILVH